MAVLGYGVFWATWAYLAVRVSGNFLVFLHLAATSAPVARWQHFDISEARRLSGATLSAIALPLGDTLFLQGPLLALGFAGTAASVLIFNTARTLSRISIQLTMIVSTSLVPEISFAYGSGDRVRMGYVISLNTLATCVVLFPIGIFLIFTGSFIVSIWTQNAIVVPGLIMGGIAVMTIVNGAWQTMANSLVATNKQGEYSYGYVLVGAIVVPATFALDRYFGLFGAVLGIAFAHGFLCVIVYVGLRKHNLLFMDRLVSSGSNPIFRVLAAVKTKLDR